MIAMKWLRVSLAASAILVTTHSRVDAQEKVYDVISNVYFASQDGLQKSIAGINFIPLTNVNALQTSGVIASALVIETAAFPIGSSSGGFTYFFDAKTGTAVRSSPSFGPAFAERPLTNGRGKFNVGLTYLHRSFTQLERTDLNDGSLKFYGLLVDRTTLGNTDIIESSFTLNVRSDTTTLFATYGVMNKLDLSVAVPFQQVSVGASVSSQLVRFGPGRAVGTPIPAFSASGTRSASGIGDTALRAKYNLINLGQVAVAAGVDVRLPTGDVRNLLGTGRTRTKMYGAFSGQMSKFFPHANIGYTLRSKSDPSKNLFFFGPEMSYAAGAEYVLNPRLTIIGDVVGRSLSGGGRLQSRSRGINLQQTATTAAETRTITELTFVDGLRLSSALTSIGGKFSPFSTFIVSAHVLFPMTSAGLKSRPTPVIGVDYSF